MTDRYRYNLRGLNNCGCFEGVKILTPKCTYNRHGLDKVDYRVGDHTRFKQTMLAMLSSTDLPALQKLQTREDDDFSIALIDAWACVADVLTFYQERIANESFLRTASERLSILELARLIGYRLSPGVAASTHLAFTLDDAPGDPSYATARTTIDIGNKVQSTPGPDETPQMFETIEALDARVEWNAIRPRLTQTQDIDIRMGSVILAGTTSQVAAEDYLLIVGESGLKDVKRVRKVTLNASDNITRIDFDDPELSPSSYVRPALPYGYPEDFPSQTQLTTEVVEELIAKTWNANDLRALAELQGWPLDTLAGDINRVITVQEPLGAVHVFRLRASLFGYNAPKLVTYNDDTPKPAEDWKEWEVNTEVESDDVLYLDGEHKAIAADSYIQIRRPIGNFTYQLLQADIITRNDYGISGKTTKLTLAAGDTWWTANWTKPRIHFGNVIRQTTVLAQSEVLPLAPVPIEDPVSGDTITLAQAYLELTTGQTIALTGEVMGREGELQSEVLVIKDVWIEAGFTVLEFQTALKESYVRNTVSINVNVALATHGETVQEILGSGDASRSFQAFVLKQTPLTYIAADTASGTASTLEIRVDDVLWREESHFLDRGPNERIYVTRVDDDGTVSIHFGDGINGARLPSGQNNIRAKYRIGIGLGGLVKARRINQLMTRPLGVRDASNPLVANGADDAETRDAARDNAPITVKTLDRTVSLQDYEDFTRAFAGIAKAQAVRVWDGNTQRVFISVAGPGGTTIENSSNIYEKLLGALEQAGDPYVNFTVKTYRPAFFRIEAGVYVDPSYLADKVIDDVKQALRDAFCFECRAFAQMVSLSEIFSVIQSVEGVTAVDMDKCYRSDARAARLKHRLNAAGAMRTESGDILAAELLLLDPAPLDAIKVLS